MTRHLAYIVALDRAGMTGHRNLAKMLVSSLLRTRFDGDIMVFHNSPHPLFMVPREGVQEVILKAKKEPKTHDEFVGFAQSCKHTVARHLQPEGYDKVIFLDCDCLVLRPINHLLEGDWSLAVITESGTRIQNGPYGGYLTAAEHGLLRREGMNSGTWAISAPLLKKFLRQWRAAEKLPPAFECLREQSAFNRVVLDWPGMVLMWPHEEIALPFCHGNRTCYRDFSTSAIVHAAGAAGPVEKLPFIFGLFCSQFLCDDKLTMFNVMEM